MGAVYKKTTSNQEEQNSSNLNELLSELVNKKQIAKQEQRVNSDKYKNPYSWIDIIEFCESPYFLGLNLFPWQKLILKLFYMGSNGNQHLSVCKDTDGCKSCIWNKNTLRGTSPCLHCSQYPEEKFNADLINIEKKMWVKIEELEKLLNLKSEEKENLFRNEQMLLEQDLIDDSDAKDGGSVKKQVLSKIGNFFSELLLVLGRRSGKSMIVSIIALYESYKVIEMGNPQIEFGNLNEGDTICILNVAVSEQQAQESVFDKIKPMIINSGYFKDKISPGSIQKKSVRFLTSRDKEVNEQLINEGLPAREGSIYLLSGHSNSDSLVGKNLLVVIIDEMASMVAKDGSKMSDEELYIKLKHSIWTFGENGKIICISNPLTKDGKFYELYEQSFNDKRMLMVQLPSYKVNPTLVQEVLDAERENAVQERNYDSFLMQIEARFSGGALEPFLRPELIDVALEKGIRRRKAEVGHPNMLYYMHLDPANNSDNYALAIVHVEEDPLKLDMDRKPAKIVVVDHIHMWQPTETGEPVNVSEVDTYVIKMTRRFPICSITYDMWESAASSQLLQRMGLPARITPYSSTYKQAIYSTLRNLFITENIEFYGMDGYDPESRSESYGFVREMMDQFRFLTRKMNHHSFSVSATPQHYDDIPDCVAGAAYQALNNQYGRISLPKMGSVKMHPFK